MALKKKQEKAEEGAPAWMVTYGDMVTLLLTFFVLLLAMSEIKKDQKVLEFMQAVKQVFGYSGGLKHVPTQEVHVPRNVMDAILLITPIFPKQHGHSPDETRKQKQPEAQIIRPGKDYQPGAKFQFEPLAAVLTEAEVAAVRAEAEKMRGYTSVFEIWGLCSQVPVEGTQYPDHMALGYARARFVYDVLVESGINPQRLRIVGAGVNRPARSKAYDEVDYRKNDVVELLQTDEAFLTY